MQSVRWRIVAGYSLFHVAGPTTANARWMVDYQMKYKIRSSPFSNCTLQ